MADFCKKCEVEMFGDTVLNVPDDTSILCEGCGGIMAYGDGQTKAVYVVSAIPNEPSGLQEQCVVCSAVWVEGDGCPDKDCANHGRERNGGV